VDHYLQIRFASGGLSIREIAKKLGYSRDTVKKAQVQATPLPYRRTSPAACSKLGEFVGLIEQILIEDQTAPRKQRHTAMRMFQRLRDELSRRQLGQSVEQLANNAGVELAELLAVETGKGSFVRRPCNGWQRSSRSIRKSYWNSPALFRPRIVNSNKPRCSSRLASSRSSRLNPGSGRRWKNSVTRSSPSNPHRAEKASVPAAKRAVGISKKC
jgi:hypothetical protein